ncbi:MAG: spore coat U domain-containing protein [Polaromonas sp.]|uniref:Csu type fimbrial protein n=1 Tax=Polaromonas sp. TaxID=1869339 RepID=UPI0024892EFE|nr:spore coat U domain-containing protein [Polaromonas sp.]MDI1238540.1 spore coat U domain-containing protein [Polaromonas sp.]
MRRWLALVALLLLASASAHAACTKVKLNDLNFGDYSGVVNDTTAQLTVRCDSGFAYSVILSGGGSANVNARTMTESASGNKLNYSVYRDAARSAVWTDVPGTTTIDGVGTDKDQSYNVYGRIPAGQVVMKASYQDSPTVSAGGSVDQVRVSTKVVASCTISAGTLNFGSYTGAVLNAVGTLSVTCNTPTGYHVGLGVGTAPGATESTRKMTGPSASTLAYALFSNAGRTTNWGNIGGTGTVAGSGTGRAQTLTVYGRMVAGQSIATPGLYTDTVIATVSY